MKHTPKKKNGRNKRRSEIKMEKREKEDKKKNIVLIFLFIATFAINSLIDFNSNFNEIIAINSVCIRIKLTMINFVYLK